MNTSSQPHQLYTIPFSHYNERARFALDYARISYVENGYAPLLHMLPIAARSPTKSTSTPLFISNDGATVLQDSGEILRFVDQFLSEDRKLYPSHLLDEIREVEQILHDKLGVYVRVFAYWNMCSKLDNVWELSYNNYSGWQGSAFAMCRKWIIGFIFMALRVNEETAANVAEKIGELMEVFSQKLDANGGQFLVGDRFTAADLTFASLASLALGVNEEDGYGAWLPPLHQFCEGGQTHIRKWRETNAAQHVMRVYREYRGKAVIPRVK